MLRFTGYNYFNKLLLLWGCGVVSKNLVLTKVMCLRAPLSLGTVMLLCYVDDLLLCSSTKLAEEKVCVCDFWDCADKDYESDPWG